MYANQLGRFYHSVGDFEARVGSLERQISREGERDFHRERLEDALGGVLSAAADVEAGLSGAGRLLQGTRETFRALTSGFFCRSPSIERALRKPRGYAGDHALLDMYYLGHKAPRGIDRVLDDVHHATPAVQAVLDRKSYVVRWLAPRIAAHPTCRVVDLASGPCRMERELLEGGWGERARLVAVDQDPEALVYALEVLGEYAHRVELVQENALRIARARTPHPSLAGARYVVSLGLFDYLPRLVAVNLLRALRRLVEPGGEVLVGNFATGNPTRTFMEWAADWVLVYRSEREFLDLFLDAGFEPRDLTLERERARGLVLLVSGRVRR